MKENNIDYDNKVQKVVKNKIKTETVKIRGRITFLMLLKKLTPIVVDASIAFG